MCWLFHIWSKWVDLDVEMWSIEAKRKYFRPIQYRRCADCNMVERRKV